MDRKQEAVILLVEDNPADIDLIKYTFKKNKIENRLITIMDGQSAIDYIVDHKDCGEGYFEPDLIILDINLPKRSGLEVLEVIKNDDDAKVIPVVMLTTSASPTDIDEAYQHYVNAYLVKPVEMHDFIDVITKLEDFMIKVIKRPLRKG